MKYKSVICNLCGNSVLKTLTSCKIAAADADFQIDDLNLVKCGKCGLVFINPRPEFTPEELCRLYSKTYFDAEYMKFYLGSEGRQSNESFEYRLDLIGKYQKPGKILDVGCAGGGLLDLARKNGWETYGIDISPEAGKSASERFGLKIQHGNLEEGGYESGSFDVVTLGDILEHTKNPMRFLEEVRRILKPNGLLYLAAPDFDGFYYSVALLLSQFNHKNYFVLPLHLYQFNRATLRKYLETQKFKVLEIKPSSSNIVDRNLKGVISQVILNCGKLIGREDRVIVIGQKSE